MDILLESLLHSLCQQCRKFETISQLFFSIDEKNFIFTISQILMQLYDIECLNHGEYEELDNICQSIPGDCDKKYLEQLIFLKVQDIYTWKERSESFSHFEFDDSFLKNELKEQIDECHKIEHPAAVKGYNISIYSKEYIASMLCFYANLLFDRVMAIRECLNGKTLPEVKLERKSGEENNEQKENGEGKSSGNEEQTTEIVESNYSADVSEESDQKFPNPLPEYVIAAINSVKDIFNIKERTSDKEKGKKGRRPNGTIHFIDKEGIHHNINCSKSSFFAYLYYAVQEIGDKGEINSLHQFDKDIFDVTVWAKMIARYYVIDESGIRDKINNNKINENRFEENEKQSEKQNLDNFKTWLEIQKNKYQGQKNNI